jgi:outer membrane protein OmpA-like peptidoglycan-associated protein
MKQDLKKIIQRSRGKIRIEAKRAVEVWIYSFADMYMILVFFFIALTALYVKRMEVAQKELEKRKVAVAIPSAGRGPQAAESMISVEFPRGAADLDQVAIEELTVLLPIVKNNASALLDIEGYADSAPLKKDAGFSSNLELSAKRAVRVAEWFMNQGVSPSRVRTYSYGNGTTFSSQPGVKTDRRVLVKFYVKGGL